MEIRFAAVPQVALKPALGSLTGRKSREVDEATNDDAKKRRDYPRMNERDYPHIVEIALHGGGFGRTLDVTVRRSSRVEMNHLERRGLVITIRRDCRAGRPLIVSLF